MREAGTSVIGGASARRDASGYAGGFGLKGGRAFGAWQVELDAAELMVWADPWGTDERRAEFSGLRLGIVRRIR